MGLPKISIAFKTAGITAIKRGERGIVALILKDSAKTGTFVMSDVSEIPEGISDYNREQILLAMMGTANPPKRVIAYVLPAAATNYDAAMNYLETIKWDYLAIPGIADADVTTVATWIKQLRSTKDKKIKAVLPKCEGDNEGIVNFVTDEIKVGEKTYTASDYCSRMAGILAGMPLTISATYQVLTEVDDVPHLKDTELNKGIDNGELILYHDGEKVKIARAVNSFVSATKDKGEDFKKIKIVDILDLIHQDIKKTAEDYYIGKVANSYDNKCLLISAIQAYFEALELDGLLDTGKNQVFIDILAQSNYLKGIGVDVSNMSEQQIKEANTKDKVFLSANIKPLDAVEDITLSVTL
ncbi:MAG: phage tail sheath subtilisin-like domain-containing protein [Bacillota bacterium]